MPIPAPITPEPGEAQKILRHVVDMSRRHFEIKYLTV
jgi:hypothetical protein